MQGVKHYMDLKQDREEANQLMSRELRIVELSILSELEKTELLMNDMEMRVGYHLDTTYKLYHDTFNALSESDFIQATAIAFEPYYYPEEGRWFEPRCIRRKGNLLNENIGGPDHDYFKMDWYRQGLANTGEAIQWSKPYIDHSQDDEPLMSLIRPLKTKEEKVIGVLCIDVSLMKLRQLLQEAEPYDGSVCQLLDDDGRLLVSSDSVAFDSTKYFVDVKAIEGHGLQVRLASPKSKIYGLSRMQNTLTLILMLAGLLTLAYIIQRSYYNTLHLNYAQQKQQLMKNEMRIAHKIQMNILRRDFPDNLSATLLPMKEVGGDLYDFYQRDDTLYFIIGDVSGKGVSAAMMMSSTVNLFRMAAQHYSTPEEIVSQINSVLSERNPSLMFVTAFVGKLDMQHGLLTYCNAGHNPPIVNGQLLSVDPDIPIGYDVNYEYRQRGVLFPEGSRIVLYTDGITEIRNSEREFMGTGRLLNIVREHQSEGPQQLTATIMQHVHAFADETPHPSPLIPHPSSPLTRMADDMTLLCISNPTPVQSPALVISNDVEEITRVKSLTREYCQCLGCDKRLTRKVMLAVEEAVANVINYAYPKGELGRIEIDILAMPPTEAQEGDITIVITDAGQPFNPLAKQDIDVQQVIDDRQIGGLGIHLYQQLMDNVLYQRTDDKNILTLSKVIK